MAEWSRRRAVWVASICVGAIALLALVLDHRAHVLGVLPYLLLLACPLMHLWHGGHHGHAAPPRPRETPSHHIGSPDNFREGGQS